MEKNELNSEDQQQKPTAYTMGEVSMFLQEEVVQVFPLQLEIESNNFTDL